MGGQVGILSCSISIHLLRKEAANQARIDMQRERTPSGIVSGLPRVVHAGGETLDKVDHDVANGDDGLPIEAAAADQVDLFERKFLDVRIHLIYPENLDNSVGAEAAIVRRRLLEDISNSIADSVGEGSSARNLFDFDVAQNHDLVFLHE